MDDLEKVLALLAVVAGAFKAIASGLKDIQDIKSKRKPKRRSPAKKKRRTK